MKSIYTWEQVHFLMEHPHLIGHLCGKTKLTDLHSSWMHWMLDHKEKRGLLAHRGSFKSTCITEIGPIYCLMKNPEETICIVRKSFTLASEMVKEIMQMMESPPIYYLLLHCWFADANNNIPDNAEWHFTTRKEGKLDLSIRQNHTKECSITAFGLNGNFTGQHFTRLILDDVTSYFDRIFSVEREFTIMMVNELLSNIINRGCPSCVLGTPWQARDALACLEESGIPFRKWNVEMTGLMTSEEIEEVKKSQTDPLFQANYMLSFVSTEDMIFTDPVMNVPWDAPHAKDICAHIDASYGGADSTALTIACRLPDNKIGMVGFLWHRHIDDIIEEIYRKMSQYKAHTLYMEENADKGSSLKKILSHPLSATYSIIGKSYNESQNKQIKIATHLHDRWYHLMWAPETEADYINQICDWTENSKDFDDAPDSAASLLREAGFTDRMNWKKLYQ